jgi:hypothetical protein
MKPEKQIKENAETKLNSMHSFVAIPMALAAIIIFVNLFFFIHDSFYRISGKPKHIELQELISKVDESTEQRLWDTILSEMLESQKVGLRRMGFIIVFSIGDWDVVVPRDTLEELLEKARAENPIP